MKIHEFRLEPFEIVKIPLNWDAQTISVLSKDGSIWLYARIESNQNPIFERYFACFPTGDSSGLPGLVGRRTKGSCLGTVKLGSLVFHVYEVMA
jgi:hypothetical protein